MNKFETRNVIYIDGININCDRVVFSENVDGLVFLKVGYKTISSFLLEYYTLEVDFIHDDGTTFWTLNRK